MHELPVTKSILEIVLRHAEAQGVTRVATVHLSIGALSDLESEWLQRYFDHLSRGTLAEGAKLQVRRSPLTFLCEPCCLEYVASRKELETASCPGCGSREGSLIGGTAYTVESMEAEG
jgi:hydrogenase nickel incorporation protein HypA/HybF